MGTKMKAGRRSGRVGLLVCKWGNSLAVRLSAESAKQLGVGEGDTLVGEIAPGGRLILSAEARAIGKADAKKMREFVSRQRVTAPVVDGMRRNARY